MKKILLLTMIFGFTASLFAQQMVPAPKEYRNIAVPDMRAIDNPTNLEKGVNPYVKSGVTPTEADVGETVYDLQTNSCTQNRFVVHEDGTMGAAWTYGMDDGSGFAGRGTGYNFYDGSAWGAYPDKRIESDRCGWPSYDAWGENGEITCAHLSGGSIVGLLINKREQKGSGEWTEIHFEGPEGHEGVLWPRMVTSGENNEVIHIIYLTRPVANGGAIYEGQDGALLYARSLDGGETWDIKDQIIDGLGEDNYVGFSGDGYTWIDPQGDNIAFLLGDNWTDFILMKSSDAGETWEKHLIWEHPYPMFDPGTPYVVDTFYCNDGAFHGAYDMNGKIHVTFGINRALADDAGTYWFPLVEGLAYWNEDRETFSANVDALSPYTGDDPDSELEELYSLIGWVPDTGGEPGWFDDLVDPSGDGIGAYFLSPSSMPQMVIDANNHIYITFSAVSDQRATQTQNYRQLFATRGTDNGETWLGEFVWLTESPVHTFDECVFASAAPHSDDNFYLLYQRDEEPGLAIRGDEDPYTNNTLTYMSVPKTDVIGVNEINPAQQTFTVYQNYPNPFNASSIIEVSLEKSADVELTIYNNMGQVVNKIDKGTLHSGLHKIEVNAANLSAGSYFFTVKVNEEQVTKQMIVR